MLWKCSVIVGHPLAPHSPPTSLLLTNPSTHEIHTCKCLQFGSWRGCNTWPGAPGLFSVQNARNPPPHHTEHFYVPHHRVVVPVIISMSWTLFAAPPPASSPPSPQPCMELAGPISRPGSSTDICSSLGIPGLLSNGLAAAPASLHPHNRPCCCFHGSVAVSPTWADIAAVLWRRRVKPSRGRHLALLEALFCSLRSLMFCPLFLPRA